MVPVLELAFLNKSLRDICESQLRAERRLGIGIAAALRARLADLWDADMISEVEAGPPRILDETPPGRVAIPLGDDASLVFTANHVAIPRTESGGVDWAAVTRIKIIHIGKLYG
jgi:hypothetical protein